MCTSQRRISKWRLIECGLKLEAVCAGGVREIVVFDVIYACNVGFEGTGEGAFRTAPRFRHNMHCAFVGQ
jgi:hypothetical protein